MELHHWVWMSGATLLACYFILYKFGRTLNSSYYDLKLGDKRHLLPPGDMGWPLIGNMLSFINSFKSSNPDSFIHHLQSKYGRSGIYKTHMFLNPSIIVCSPETCKRVLNDDDNFKLGNPTTAATLTKSILNDVSTADIRRFRRLVTSPILGHNALAMYLERIEEIVVNSLEEMASSSMKQPIEIFKEAKFISLRIIINVFMGSYNQDKVKQVEDLFSHFKDAMFSWPINFPGFPYHKALKTRNKLSKLAQSIVDERKMMIENGQVTEKRDLIDALLELQDENGRKMDSEEIVDLLIFFLLAGHASTATSIMWTMIYLTRNPKIMKKAKEEQEEIMRARPPSQKRLSLTEIKQMVYLSQVIDEIMRVSNIAFSLFREATNDVNINGYIIPKGWRVLVWLRGIHMDPEYYPNPEEFDPSRFKDNNAKSGGTLLPFGAGIRLCPGRDLTRIEMATFLHHFILHYKFEQVNPECPITYLPITVPTDNCLARVIKVSA